MSIEVNGAEEGRDPPLDPAFASITIAKSRSGYFFRALHEAYSTPENRLCGTAGEYFVAAELSRLGYVASITLRNVRGIDILVSNVDATQSVGIQVKTNQGSEKEWILSKKAESEIAENLFYIFVNLNGGSMPEYHIVPRNIVAKYVRETHQKWLKTPGRGGRSHVDSPVRKFADQERQFLGRWDLLGLANVQANTSRDTLSAPTE